MKLKKLNEKLLIESNGKPTRWELFVNNEGIFKIKIYYDTAAQVPYTNNSNNVKTVDNSKEEVFEDWFRNNGVLGNQMFVATAKKLGAKIIDDFGYKIKLLRGATKRLNSINDFIISNGKLIISPMEKKEFLKKDFES